MIALPIACLAWIAAVVIIFVIYFKWKKSISNRSKQKLTSVLSIMIKAFIFLTASYIKYAVVKL